jgi:DNA-binding LytR/AlgR family response regulator
MTPSKVLIVEDEAITAMDIEVRLKRMGFRVVGQIHKPDGVIAEIKHKNPDLVLLDINLKGKEEGIDLAEEIDMTFNVPVVFLTAFGDDSTFKKAMATCPYGYVTKPFKDKDLKHAIEIALAHHQSLSFAKSTALQYKKLLDIVCVDTDDHNNKVLFVKDGSNYTKIKLDAIQWIEAYDAYSKIHTKEKTIIANALLKDLYQKLPHDKFIRVHRSYIVGLTHIEKIEKDNIHISDTQIPVSKSHKAELMQHLDII